MLDYTRKCEARDGPDRLQLFIGDYSSGLCESLGTPGFNGATDLAPDAEAAANAIADDVSADATATLGYCRASSADTIITLKNAHIDGEAGTSGADFNFNTLAIVSGATVSMTAWTFRLPQGPTAT